jgi:hypothetical protein
MASAMIRFQVWEHIRRSVISAGLVGKDPSPAWTRYYEKERANYLSMNVLISSNQRTWSA